MSDDPAIRDDPDRLWFDALAGRLTRARAEPETDHAPREAVAEGLLLRDGLLAQLAAAEAAERSLPEFNEAVEPRVDADRELELIARARAVGLLVADPAAPIDLRRARRSPGIWPGYAAAAVLLLTVGASVGVRLWKLGSEPRVAAPSTSPPALRAVPGGTVHLRDPDPAVLRRRLEEQLRAEGVQVAEFTRFGRLGIDADLPVPVPPRIRDILRSHDVPIPADGVLSVEIEAPER